MEAMMAKDTYRAIAVSELEHETKRRVDKLKQGEAIAVSRPYAVHESALAIDYIHYANGEVFPKHAENWTIIKGPQKQP